MTQLLDKQASGTRGQTRSFDPTCLFGGVLWQARWAVLLGLLVLSLTHSLPGRAGLPTWALILLFAGYNLGLELLRHFTGLLGSTAWLPLLDLPVVAALYSASAAPGGPLFVLFLLVVSCAASVLSLRASLLYTAVVMGIIALVAPTLPFWLETRWQTRELGAQLLVTLLVGAGTALLIRQLAREQEQAQTSRDEAARLAELDQLRTRFIATISHDLRTPLTAVKGGLGMLEASVDARLAERERRLVENMRRNIERLDGYIGDLLALNQLEAGVLQLDCEPLDLRVVVASCLPLAQQLLDERGQTLAIALPTALPVLGDQRRLEQVVINLLGNAHVHTPPGTLIEVSGRTTAHNTVLSVRDTGPGLPPEALPRLFTPFWQGEGSRGGTGLGLAIVKGLIELHHGQIAVESQPGAGTAFHVTLPRYQEEQPHAATSADRRG